MNRIPTLAVVLKSRIDKYGEQTILIRATFERKAIYKSLGIKVKAENFKANAEAFKYIQVGDARHLQKNTIIKQELEQLDQMYYNHVMQGPLSLEMVKMMFDNQTMHGMYIVDLALEYIKTKIDNEATKRKWMHSLELIKMYAPSNMITAINKKWLVGFTDFLTLKYGNTNTRLSSLKFIRAVVNFAIERGVEMDYPFGKGKFNFPIANKTMRNYLTQAELASIENYVLNECADEKLSKIGKWFLLQCACGMRASDILNWNEDYVRDQRIHFTDKKTATPHFIPIYPKLQEAINRIIGLELPNYEQYKRSVSMLGVVCKLRFPLTTHVGRHTFAVHYLERGGNIFFLQSLLGHGDIKTTMIYAKITNQGLEDDMRRTHG